MTSFYKLCVNAWTPMDLKFTRSSFYTILLSQTRIVLQNIPSWQYDNEANTTYQKLLIYIIYSYCLMVLFARTHTLLVYNAEHGYEGSGDVCYVCPVSLHYCTAPVSWETLSQGKKNHCVVSITYSRHDVDRQRVYFLDHRLMVIFIKTGMLMCIHIVTRMRNRMIVS